MKPSEALLIHRDAIRRIVDSHHATNPRVFGSVLHGVDTVCSDLDLLVDPQSNTTLLDLGGLQDELHELLGVPVDVKTPGDLPTRFREAVLEEAKPL